jgi:hypothetical protein
MENKETKPTKKTLEQILKVIKDLLYRIGLISTCLIYLFYGVQPSNMLMLGLILLAIELKLKK